MEPGKAPNTSDKWLDTPVSLPGLREKIGISSGVIWGIVLCTQKGIQIFCTLEKYKKHPFPFPKEEHPKKVLCYRQHYKIWNIFYYSRQF